MTTVVTITTVEGERACGNAIALVEAAQMQLVKANFVEA